ncbi:unnamed protein product [Lampetra planeri]
METSGPGGAASLTSREAACVHERAATGQVRTEGLGGSRNGKAIHVDTKLRGRGIPTAGSPKLGPGSLVHSAKRKSGGERGSGKTPGVDDGGLSACRLRRGWKALARVQLLRLSATGAPRRSVNVRQLLALVQSKGTRGPRGPVRHRAGHRNTDCSVAFNASATR